MTDNLDNRQLSAARVSRETPWRKFTRLSRVLVAFLRRHLLILLGIGASISYGMWGFLEKLTAAQSPVIVNMLVYGTAFLVSLSGLRKFRPPTATAIIAGIAGGAINGIVLVMLQHHALTLVFPFISVGSVCFIGLSFLLINERLHVRSLKGFWSGVVMAVVGMSICGIAVAGGLQRVRAATADVVAVCMAGLIAILTGIWLVFAFLTIVRNKYEPLIATTWVFLGSFGVSIVVALLTSVKPRVTFFSLSTLIALCAGVFMFLGELATYHGFAGTDEGANRAEHVLTGLLANSELVPVLILSHFVFRDVSIEAAAGCILVIVGIGVLNSVRM